MGLTLREGSREHFYAALDRLFPGLKEKYIRAYGNAYYLSSPNEKKLMSIYRDFCDKHGILHGADPVFSYLEEFPESDAQTSLFDA
jgi:hypothetical protein